jgi:hypothetical protein
MYVTVQDGLIILRLSSRKATFSLLPIFPAAINQQTYYCIAKYNFKRPICMLQYRIVNKVFYLFFYSGIVTIRCSLSNSVRDTNW